MRFRTMKLRKATPVEHRRGTAFVTRARGCTSEEILTPVYKAGPEAERLNQIRRDQNMPLRDMASRLGFCAAERCRRRSRSSFRASPSWRRKNEELTHVPRDARRRLWR